MLSNVVVGVAGTGTGYVNGKGLVRIVNPASNSNAELQLLRSEGVEPTVGRTIGELGAADTVI